MAVVRGNAHILITINSSVLEETASVAVFLFTLFNITYYSYISFVSVQFLVSCNVTEVIWLNILANDYPGRQETNKPGYESPGCWFSWLISNQIECLDT